MSLTLGNARVLSDDGDLVEACVWFAPLARTGRRATAIRGQEWESIVDEGVGPAAQGAPLDYLIEPSPAVVQAHLLDSLARRLDAQRCSRTWLTHNEMPNTMLARSWRVIERVPAPGPALRDRLRGLGSITYKTLDAGISAEEAGRRTGHRASKGGAAVTIAVLDRRDAAYVVEPA